MAIITLTTDFGNKDHFVPALKGSILKEIPDATLVDVSHEISPFNIQECAYVLKNAYRAFPKGTIHIVGLDSEPSPENEHIVVYANGHFFIGANNGVISLITCDIKRKEVFEINLQNMEKTTFPTHAVFLKAACHLAKGGKPGALGKAFHGLKELKEFEPRILGDGKSIAGNVIYLSLIHI